MLVEFEFCWSNYDICIHKVHQKNYFEIIIAYKFLDKQGENNYLSYANNVHNLTSILSASYFCRKKGIFYGRSKNYKKG